MNDKRRVRQFRKANTYDFTISTRRGAHWVFPRLAAHADEEVRKAEIAYGIETGPASQSYGGVAPKSATETQIRSTIHTEESGANMTMATSYG